MNKLYIIGGSPCSGKSTVTEELVRRYGLNYFKVDDHLDEYTEHGANDNKEICCKQATATSEEIWMRDPQLQNREELQFYREIFPYLLEDLKNLNCEKGVITEGAAYLPELIGNIEDFDIQYLAMTPTREFQISHYCERPWIHFVLEGCSNEEQAFSNWMERDVLFAEIVRKQCDIYGYRSIVTDENSDIGKVTEQVEKFFMI